jgi:hypothetical protein
MSSAPMTTLSFGWSIFHRPLMWGTLAWLGSMLLLAVSLFFLITVPDKWDRAVAIKVCSGLPILRQQDGSIWLRHRWRAYRVENLQELSCG